MLNVASVAAAQRNQNPPISWGAIMVKAIALVSQHHPELKRCYMPLPWAHLYEHPYSVAVIAIERQWQGERAVFFDQIPAPERKPLREIDRTLQALKKAPVEAIGGFRRLIRHTRLPPPFRRLIWCIVLYTSGYLRSRYIGTFSINSVPGRGFPIQVISLPAINFYYGSVAPNGDLHIQIFFDHRMIDGVAVNRLLSKLTVALHHKIVAELNAQEGTQLPTGT